jgi:hypothetical protein
MLTAKHSLVQIIERTTESSAQDTRLRDAIANKECRRYKKLPNIEHRSKLVLEF